MKLIRGIMLALLFMGMLTLALSVQPVAAVDWWPMFHHDLSHTGCSTSTAPNTNNILWSCTTGGVVSSSPAVTDGKVYVGGGFNVYCLDALTGGFIWSYPTGDIVFSSPAVAGGRVYVGSYDGKVYCFGGPPLPVGGFSVPIGKPVAPYVGLTSTILVATVATAVYAKRVMHRKEKQ